MDILANDNYIRSVYVTSNNRTLLPNEQIVKAIYLAEGGSKATWLYGIRSIPYKDAAEARQICFNSVRNGRKRWIEAGKPYDLITFIGLRYCPPKAHPLNSNWVKNVRYFLEEK